MENPESKYFTLPGLLVHSDHHVWWYHPSWCPKSSGDGIFSAWVRFILGNVLSVFRCLGHFRILSDFWNLRPFRHWSEWCLDKKVKKKTKRQKEKQLTLAILGYFLKYKSAVVFWWLAHSLRWDITNICNFPLANIRLILEKAPQPYLDKSFLQRKSSADIFRQSHLFHLICRILRNNFVTANLSESDKCLSSICKFNLCKGTSNLCLIGQIGEMSNWNPIYRSYNNGCNIVHINCILKLFTYLVSKKIRSVPNLSWFWERF